MPNLRLFSPLLGLVVAAPLWAQTTAKQTPNTAKSATAPGAVASTSAPKDTAVTWVVLNSNDGKLKGQFYKLLKAEMAKARAMGKTPFLEFGAMWCGPCQNLEADLHTPEIIDAFSGAYIVHVDANEWDVDDELVPLGATGGLMPILMALDKNGKVVAENHGYTGLEYGGVAPIKEFVQAHVWKASAPKVAAH